MNIEMVWNNIKRHEGESFYKVGGGAYKYVVYSDYLLINNLKSRRITKRMLEKAIAIENPTPSKIESEGCWGPSYIWGIITDKRIKDIQTV